MTAPLGVEAVVRVTLVLAVGLAVLPVLRSRSAALRHWVLSVTLVVAAVAPGVPGVLPVGSAATRLWTAIAGPAPTGPRVTETTVLALPAATGATAPPVAATRGSSLASAVTFAWGAGATGFLLLLATGLARLQWLAARSQPPTEARCHAIAGELIRRHGVRRHVRVLQSDHPTLLVTWGLLRPTIVLPRAAVVWPEPRLRLVLAHEMAHIARGDWAAQMLAELVRAVYWFNPLAWAAVRSLRCESERAADDAVLSDGVDAYDYATELVALARELARRRHALVPAVTMARRSGFEKRITAMMNTELDHTAGSWRSRMAAAGLLVVLIGPVAAATPTSNPDASPQATLSGAVVDPTGRPVPGVRIVAARAGDDTNHETYSDVRGLFAFPSLPPGDYRIAASLAGFRTSVLSGVVLGSEPVTARFAMEVGALSEAINVRGTMQTVAAAGGNRPRAGAVAAPTRPCVSDAAGGDIKEPRKIRDVRPSYPAHLVPDGVEGIVILEGVVSKDGTVTGIQILREPHPDLGAAAVEAVSQWLYMPTLLNCEPIEVVVTVTINFTVER